MKHKHTRNLKKEHVMFENVDFFNIILLSRESNEGAIYRTNSDSLRSCLCFVVFRLIFASDFFNSLLVKFYHAEIIMVKHLV